MQSRTEPPSPDEENWADYIDRLTPFVAPTVRLRRAAWRLDHPDGASPPTATPAGPAARQTVRT
ncbi:MAG: hypothetical protein U1F52_01865 [Burkholderiales bacterium]